MPLDDESIELNLDLTEEDLAGFSLSELKCRACSGYGNCGYRMYKLDKGKPVLICQMRRDELIKQRETNKE